MQEGTDRRKYRIRKWDRVAVSASFSLPRPLRPRADLEGWAGGARTTLSVETESEEAGNGDGEGTKASDNGERKKNAVEIAGERMACFPDIS